MQLMIPEKCGDLSFPVYFNSFRAGLTSPAQQLIRDAGRANKECKVARVAVIGLADYRGTPKQNLDLSRKRALAVANATSFHDPLRCKTFSEIVVTGAQPYVIGTRLYLNNGKVIRVDSLVTKPGDWLFNAKAYLKFTTAENWQPLMKYQHTPPAEMIRGANAYLDAFADKFTDIPWGQPCARLEGGAYTNVKGSPDASCEVGIPGGVLYIVNRDYLIDPEMGVINVFCRFGSSTGGPDSHTFRFIDGKIRGVRTLSVLPGPQANDEGGIARGAADPNAKK